MTVRSFPSRLKTRLTTLDRYVFHQLLIALLATTGGLAALIWLMQSLRFVSLVVDRGLSLRVFIELTSLLIPSFVAVVLPITTFVVSLFVYQRLAGDRELTVMRAAGLSPFALARPGLTCALMATLIGFLLNLWVVPVSYHHFRQFEFQIRNKMAAFMLQEGVFTKVSDVMTVYIRERSHDGTLHGIVVEDDRQPNSRATILANRGTMMVVDDTPRVILYDGSRQVIDHKTGRLDMLIFEQDSMDLSSTHQEDSRFRDAAEMSLNELLNPDPREVAPRDTGKFKVEGWRRLTSPLTCFSFAMVGLFAVLRGVFSRHGNIKRPLAAVLSVVGLLAINLLLQNLASRNMALIPLIPLVALLPGLICAAILFVPELRQHSRTRTGLRKNAPLMVVSVTLSLYIARQFVFSVLAMIASLTGIVCLFDFIDLLRRVATRPDVSTNVVTEIAALHVPYFTVEILPFGILLGGIICFWRLTRSSELIVARAAGISAWQFLAGPLACAMLIGGIATTLVSPLSSSMYRRAEELDQQYLRTGGGPLSLSSGSLWLRQADSQYDPKGVAILHARGVQLQKGVLHIHDVSVFRLDHDDKLVMRIESPDGILGDHVWELQNAQTVRPNEILHPVGQMNLPTDLTVARVQESFSSPETLSVWALPSFIALLDRSGFSSIRHRIHFQSLLALPMLAGTMALVAAGFSMRPTRRGGVAQMIGSGVAAGFLLFTVSKVAEQFGNSGALPPILAAWAPTVAGLCLAVSLLLHLEDG